MRAWRVDSEGERRYRPPVTPFERWWFALKPASWPKLLVPMALGQGIGIDATGTVSVSGFLVGAVVTLFALATIVLLNDWSDERVDRIKRSMFPQTHPKTIPDGILGRHRVLLAGLFCGSGALLTALAGEVWLARAGLTLGTLFGLVVFASYSLPPVRLNYRGGGELLEAMGVGVVLPWFNAYAQSGDLDAPAMIAVPGFALLSIASALASGLADERSDRQGGKRTFATMIGNFATRRIAEACVVGAMLAWAAVAWLDYDRCPTIGLLAASAVLLLSFNSVIMRSSAAVTDAFDALASYKGALHGLIWESTTVLAGVLALGPWFGW